MKLIIIAIIVSLTACNAEITVEDQTVDNARVVIEDVCGAAPLAPGFSIATDHLGTKTVVIVDLDEWNTLRAYQFAMETWSACVEGRAF